MRWMSPSKQIPKRQSHLLAHGMDRRLIVYSKHERGSFFNALSSSRSDSARRSLCTDVFFLSLSPHSLATFIVDFLTAKRGIPADYYRCRLYGSSIIQQRCVRCALVTTEWNTFNGDPVNANDDDDYYCYYCYRCLVEPCARRCHRYTWWPRHAHMWLSNKRRILI